MIELFKDTVELLEQHGAEVQEHADDKKRTLWVEGKIGKLKVSLWVSPETGRGSFVGMFADLYVDGHNMSARGGGRIKPEVAAECMTAFCSEVEAALKSDAPE